LAATETANVHHQPNHTLHHPHSTPLGLHSALCSALLSLLSNNPPLQLSLTTRLHPTARPLVSGTRDGSSSTTPAVPSTTSSTTTATQRGSTSSSSATPSSGMTSPTGAPPPTARHHHRGKGMAPVPHLPHLSRPCPPTRPFNHTPTPTRLRLHRCRRRHRRRRSRRRRGHPTLALTASR
jgi:hypothetical protein